MRGVLVAGAGGMLGQAVCRSLEAAGMPVVRTQRADPGGPNYLEAECPDTEAQTGKLLSRMQPQYVINCAGVLKSEIDRGGSAAVLRAIRVNAVFPHLLARAAAHTGARVIHMSTDGVFSGRADRPYLESDVTDAADHYGRTKALGEVESSEVLNVRCSIAGRDPLRGRGLLEWLLRSPDRSELAGYADQRWNGVTTDQFAALCAAIIGTDCFGQIRRESPVIHFCPNSAITKYELLNLWREVTGKAVTLRAATSGEPGRLLASEHTAWRQACPQAPDWRELLMNLKD
jgi:dTDP-4-dehydrorhamnose reductase